MTEHFLYPEEFKARMLDQALERLKQKLMKGGDRLDLDRSGSSCGKPRGKSGTEDFASSDAEKDS